MDVLTDTVAETRSVQLRLICATPPPSLHEGEPAMFGLQDKQRSLDIGQGRPDGSVAYEFVVQAKLQADLPRFSGQYTHGTAQDPFLYLSWRRGDVPGDWIKRLKISLAGITWDQIEAATGGVIEGRVEGTGSARTPLLGDGWTVRDS